MPLLEVDDLQTHFSTEEGVVRAVDGVSFEVDRGEVLCLVGESGSGKSVTSMSLLGLIPNPPGRIVGGSIRFRPEGGEAEDLVAASEARLRKLRGDRIAMIFQDPMTSLNPYLRVGEQLVEVLEVHQRMGRAEARDRAVAMLEAVGIPAPRARLDDHPHHLSGGMRQRVMIAMALLCEPELLIADEPTTALDVTIQAQILDLLLELRDDRGLGILFITHDLGVVARMADRVAVMYAGRIVEEAPVDAIFESPRHPYTLALQGSIPRLETGPGDGERVHLPAIAGLPPNAADLPPGCSFHPRCEQAQARCRDEEPAMRHGRDRRAACHFAELESEA